MRHDVQCKRHSLEPQITSLCLCGIWILTSDFIPLMHCYDGRISKTFDRRWYVGPEFIWQTSFIFFVIILQQSVCLIRSASTFLVKDVTICGNGLKSDLHGHGQVWKTLSNWTVLQNELVVHQHSVWKFSRGQSCSALLSPSELIKRTSFF